MNKNDLINNVADAAGMSKTAASSAVDSVLDSISSALSNGDDVFALTQVGTGVVLDMIGAVGADPGSGWEVAGISDATKDHTIVRKADVVSGTGYDWAASAGTNADDSQWVVLDQNDWTYLGSHPHDIFVEVLGCTDANACNFNAEATLDDGTCNFAEENFDCAGNCTAVIDCAGACGGDAVADACGNCQGDCLDDGTGFINCDDSEFNLIDADCAGVCGGDAVADACGECQGDGSSCQAANLFFSEAAEGSSNNKYLEIFITY